MKTCPRCWRLLGVDAFGVNRRNPDGFMRECRMCWNERSRANQRKQTARSTRLPRDAFGLLMRRLLCLVAERCNVAELAAYTGLALDEVPRLLKGWEVGPYRHDMTDCDLQRLTHYDRKTAAGGGS